jgi:hypothetical protein
VNHDDQTITTGEFVLPTYSWHCKPADMVAKFARCGILYEYRNGRLELVSPLPPSSVLPKYYFDNGVLRRKQYLSARNLAQGLPAYPNRRTGNHRR